MRTPIEIREFVQSHFIPDDSLASQETRLLALGRLSEALAQYVPFFGKLQDISEINTALVIGWLVLPGDEPLRCFSYAYLQNWSANALLRWSSRASFVDEAKQVLDWAYSDYLRKLLSLIKYNLAPTMGELLQAWALQGEANLWRRSGINEFTVTPAEPGEEVTQAKRVWFI